VALSGPSGCGKTLLLRALADLDPAEGAVHLDGTDRNEMSPPEWRRQVGWLPAESAWWFDVVGDHFEGFRPEALGFRDQAFPNIGKNDVTAPRSTVPQRSCFQTLEKLGFETDVLEWRVDRLSTGERQRLALFRLLLNEPKVLLLDEPTAALDVSNVWKVEEVISNVRKTTGAAVVWVSHNPEQIARVADRHLELWKETA
jgi:ABC-type iron transport system FetAB ATPase subunit